MIDLHTHILPGIDDGARTLDDALDMARAFVADGVTTVAATPHVRDDFPTSADVMLRAVDALRQVLDERRDPSHRPSRAEMAVDWIARLDEDELRRLTLAGQRSLRPRRDALLRMACRAASSDFSACGSPVSHRCSLIRNGIAWCRRRRRCSHRSYGAGRSFR